MHLRNINLVLRLCLILAISACNDSSNSSSSYINIGTEYTADSIIQLDETQNINQSIDLLLYFPSDEVSNINWQQTAGPSVDILANTSKVISFTPTQSGDYSFNVSFTLNGSIEKTLSHNIVVNEDSQYVTARLSHAALTDNNVSFRTELYAVIDSDTLVWQQISGPEVALEITSDDGDSNNQLAIFFDAPDVDVDSIITFEVSATGSNGVTYKDSVGVLIEPGTTIGGNAYFDERVANVFVYNSDSPYADTLIPCIYSNTLTSSCKLSQTPLLAAEVTDSSIPTVEDIMDRVIVSHQWMGDRFKEFLTNDDTNNDIKSLLRATTAIVIAYDVRPSFYWAATGAIYLDAENFWLTANERDTINEAADYRSDYGNELQFIAPWRYVKDNSYAYASFSYSSRVTRTSDDGLYRLQALLYHELAHANDFFPSDEWYIHNSNSRVLDAAISTEFESDELAVSFPLNSLELYGIAQVSYAGETATSTQINYLPSDIAGFFSNDSASDLYAYASLREDYAMLFEEFMMQNRFGILRDVAFTNQPTGDIIYSSDYIVTWGQRGRIGDENVKERVLFTATRVLPEFDSVTAVNQLPAPIQMVEGDDWYENLTISPDELSLFNLSKSLDAFTTGDSVDDSATNRVVSPLENRFKHYQKPLPDH